MENRWRIVFKRGSHPVGADCADCTQMLQHFHHYFQLSGRNADTAKAEGISHSNMSGLSKMEDTTHSNRKRVASSEGSAKTKTKTSSSNNQMILQRLLGEKLKGKCLPTVCQLFACPATLHCLSLSLLCTLFTNLSAHHHGVVT